MNCPVCNNVNLEMSERQGIEIDYCPQCRGVWLDRGELDKVIERSWRPRLVKEAITIVATIRTRIGLHAITVNLIVKDIIRRRNGKGSCQTCLTSTKRDRARY